MTLRITENESREIRRVHAVYSRRSKNGRYAFSDAAYLFDFQSREREYLGILSRQGVEKLNRMRILDLGCGTGTWMREFIKWGADPAKVYGVDILPDRLSRARELSPPSCGIYAASAGKLPFPDASFDIVLQNTVFTSILDDGMKQTAAREILRVLSQRGMAIWYDFTFDNPNNPDVRGIRRQELKNLFRGADVHTWRTTLAPPISRTIAPISPLLCSMLSKLPFLLTHRFAVIRKDAGPIWLRT